MFIYTLLRLAVYLQVEILNPLKDTEKKQLAEAFCKSREEKVVGNRQWAMGNKHWAMGHMQVFVQGSTGSPMDIQISSVPESCFRFESICGQDMLK